MYLCVRGIVTKPVPGQESDWSCICVLGVSLPSQESYWSCICVLGVSLPNQESDWSCICVLGVSLPSLYQARKVIGRVSVC
jgi:hypothetical protein